MLKNDNLQQKGAEKRAGAGNDEYSGGNSGNNY